MKKQKIQKTYSEAARILYALSEYLSIESENYVENEEIREPLVKAYNKIFDLFTNLGKESNMHIDNAAKNKFEKIR